MNRAASSLRLRLPLLGSLFAVLLASCGGGGGGTNPGSAAAQPAAPGASLAASAISGYVVEGPVAGSSVSLYQVDRAGNKTLLGSAITDASGYFSIRNPAPAKAVILVEATGGRYTDEMTRQVVNLALPLRAVSVSNGGAARISVTPFSEAQVRMLERLPAPDWSAEMVAQASKRVVDVLDIPDFLDFIPVDLLSGGPAPGTRDSDVTLSFFTSGFSGYARRIDANPATSLNSALDGLRRLFSVDAHDDVVLPAFIGGVADFVDVSAATDVGKRTMKTILLTANPAGPVTPLGDDLLRKYMPTGRSSGGATAAMPDDAFQLIGARTPGTAFNSRGALVGYPLDDGNGMWRMTYLASVAEVYGDGDVGIGRWNGGTTMDGTRAGATLTGTTAAQPLMYGSWPYAVARPVTQAPSCGMRQLYLMAATQPALMSLNAGARIAAAGITGDSKVSFQFADRILAGFDIGIKGADGSVTRFTSPGGLAQPSASGFAIDPHAPRVEGRTVLAPYGDGAGSPLRIEVRGLPGGEGASRLALKLSIGAGQDPTEIAAVFAAPAGGIDSSGCASGAGSAGTAIDPAPANGAHYVLTGIGDSGINRGSAVDTIFRARGELAGKPGLVVGESTPVFELAGNADASIGRIDGDFTLDGKAYRRSMPYAVARAGGVIPASGIRHYALVASTLLVADAVPASTAGPMLGKVQSASLDVNFGEYPAGTPHEWYGTASLRVTGSLGDTPFTVASWSNPAAPLDTMLYKEAGGNFVNPVYEGALAGPGSEYAVVRITAVAGTVPVTGTLLFRAQ